MPTARSNLLKISKDLHRPGSAHRLGLVQHLECFVARVGVQFYSRSEVCRETFVKGDCAVTGELQFVQHLLQSEDQGLGRRAKLVDEHHKHVCRSQKVVVGRAVATFCEFPRDVEERHAGPRRSAGAVPRVAVSSASVRVFRVFVDDIEKTRTRHGAVARLCGR
jgi:hypothetical protein